MELFQDLPSSHPNRAWQALRPKLTKFAELTSNIGDKPQEEGTIRCVCVSDTHTLTGNLKLPKGDILIHGGDFSNTGKPREVAQFNQWLGEQTAFKHRVVIAGNHDLTFDVDNYDGLWKRFRHPAKYDPVETKALLTNCTYLEDSSVTLYGYKFYGTPWQPEFCGWGFNLDRGEPCRRVWEKIPTDTDILISHGPPLGHGDACTSGQLAGCVDLYREVYTRIKPLYHVFGHIHEGWGSTTDGQTTFINASTCTSNYKAAQPAIVFDLPIRTS